jgi:hypothetical protein
VRSGLLLQKQAVDAVAQAAVVDEAVVEQLPQRAAVVVAVAVVERLLPQARLPQQLLRFLLFPRLTPARQPVAAVLRLPPRRQEVAAVVVAVDAVVVVARQPLVARQVAGAEPLRQVPRCS